MVDDQAKAIDALKAYALQWVPAAGKDVVAGHFDRAVALSRASQGSRVGTEEERLRVARALFDLREDDEADWDLPECREVHLIEADAAIAALSPSATPQAPEDVREAVFQMIYARASHWIAKELTAELDRTHLLATPVTVTEEQCIAVTAHYPISCLGVVDILRRVLGDRIQIAGSEGPK